MVQIKLKRLQVMKPVNLGFRVLGKWRATTGMICPAGWRPGEEMHSSQAAHRDGSRLSRNTGCICRDPHLDPRPHLSWLTLTRWTSASVLSDGLY